MDAVGYAELSRKDLRRFFAEKNLDGRGPIPEDGETLWLG